MCLNIDIKVGSATHPHAITPYGTPTGIAAAPLPPLSLSTMRCASLLFLLLTTSIHAYPAYDNPILANPALVRPGQLLCTVDLVRNAACDAYNKITTQPFPAPSDVPACRGYVSRVVVDFYGFVKGVQFDRSGGVFLGDIELLRTTTPEPSPSGIAWHVEKDVSDYILYILSGPKNATLGITNIVDKTYTGVIYVNATLSFYGRPFSSTDTADDGAQSTTSSPALLRGGSNSVGFTTAMDDDNVATSSSTNGKKHLNPSPQYREEDTELLPEHGASPPLILPLVFPFNPSTGQWTSPPNLNGDANLSVSLPSWPQPNIARVYLDLIASPHGCEEFFYTNLPSEAEDVDGTSCGGGVYRELQVWVDDTLAGSLYPAVVVYTGGVNPFLWRPLSGIGSFDIPTYRFDLTPFVGLFNSAAPVPVTINTAVTLSAPVAEAALVENEEKERKSAYDSVTTILMPAPVEPETTAATAATARPKITLRAYGNNNKGFWSITSALLLHPDPDVDKSVTLSGGIDSATDSGPQFTVDMTEGQNDGRNGIHGNDSSSNTSSISSSNTSSTIVITYKTVGYHAFSVSGSLHYPNGTFSTTTTVTAHLSSWNENISLGNNTQQTRGNMADQATIERHSSDGTKLGQRRLQNQYPYFIQSYYASDDSSIELRAKVDIGFEKSHDEEMPGRPPFAASWKNRIQSKAVYNRSVDHSHTGTMFGESTETFQLFLSLQRKTDPCYDRVLEASEGYLKVNKSSYSCVFPPGLHFCGYHMCEQFAPVVVSPARVSLAGVAPKDSVVATVYSTLPVRVNIDKQGVQEGTLAAGKENTKIIVFAQQSTLHTKAVLEGARNPTWTLDVLRENA